MKYKIGIFGSAIEESSSILKKARLLGESLAQFIGKIILCTGACPGVPYEVISTARKKGKIEIIGYSPELSEKEQRLVPQHSNLSLYTKIYYIPKTFPLVKDIMARKKYRNILSTNTVDAGIIISGRWGTMNEFTNLYDMGKVIGVLTGTGGIADELKRLMQKITKKSKALVIFDSSPKLLLKKIIGSLKNL